jgi:multiple sugar transport system ATP-binding protein
MASVTLEGIHKIYQQGGKTHVAVHDIDLHIADGEFVVLVGPSGCGKSTTLRMIAGLETVSAGRLLIGDRDVTNVPPKDRDIAMVFQNYALYPHMTAYENMAFALKLRRAPRSEVDARVREAAAMLGIGDLLDRTPRSMSGGQRQRVALGRAIVRQPQVFLFDEPLSNLDAKLRTQMRREIARLHRQLGVTMIYVTHDQVEAMTLGDRIAVLDGGRLQQVDTPAELYDRPRNTFVASFIGSPAMNLIPGTIVPGALPCFRATDSDYWLALGEPWTERPFVRVGGAATLGIRPEDVRLASGAPTDEHNVARARVELVEPLGSETVVHASIGAQEIVARVPPGTVAEPGDDTLLGFDTGRVHLFDPGGDRI